MRKNSDSNILKYIENTFVEEGELFKRIRAKGEDIYSGLQISPAEGRMLQVFAKMVGAKNILEIGGFVGYSTLWLANALPDGGSVTSIERNSGNTELSCGFMREAGVCDRVDIINGKALEILPQLREEVAAEKRQKFDMVFIDAAKNEYFEYLCQVESMLGSNALVVGDNTLLFGALAGSECDKKVSPSALESMGKFNERIGKSGAYDAILLPTEEGLTIGVWKG